MADRIEQIADEIGNMPLPISGVCLLGGFSDKDVKALARAAYLATLRSIREPGEAVKAAGCSVDCPRYECAVVLACQGDGKKLALEKWQAMIDHLIAEATND